MCHVLRIAWVLCFAASLYYMYTPLLITADCNSLKQLQPEAIEVHDYDLCQERINILCLCELFKMYLMAIKLHRFGRTVSFERPYNFSHSCILWHNVIIMFGLTAWPGNLHFCTSSADRKTYCWNNTLIILSHWLSMNIAVVRPHLVDLEEYGWCFIWIDILSRTSEGNERMLGLSMYANYMLISPFYGNHDHIWPYVMNIVYKWLC